ncbi:MAG: class II aldolase/adducin family protein [Chloroflexi bacterium]|nr:class II aldolase/adducin family protein [Chloroflexota bacterium]
MKQDSESRLRQEIIRVARVVADQGLIRSSDGNISVWLDEGRFLITPTGLHKMTMEPDDLIVVDWEGRVIEGRPGLRPTSETWMHLEVYRQRLDVGAVLHAHPPFATALTIAEIPFPVDLIPEVLLTLGDIPTASYGTPGTEDLARSIRDLVREHNAVLLSHHGSLTVGKTLEDALIALERVEHAARIFYLAKTLGTVKPLPPEEIARLREIGQRMRG